MYCGVNFIFYFIQCEAWGEYCDQSRGKLDFKGSSDKDYGTNGWILARDGFAKNYMGSRPEAKRYDFFHLVCADVDDGGVWMYGWLDVIVFFVHDFLHTVKLIEMKLKTYHLFNKIKRWLVFGTYRSTKISTLFQYFFSFF